MNHVSKRRGLWALSPLVVFLFLYLGVSLWVGDFYKVPITVAFLAASAYAVCVIRIGPLEERVAVFSRGAGHEDLLTMVWIFILSGAFAAAAEAMGAVDAAVHLTLNLFPTRLLLGGVFVAACFVSISVGTSVGTIVALVPVAAGIAESTGWSLPLMAGVVVGGAFFGDNLSFISDTTIASTRTQGCQMKDKFRANILIVLPAALVALLVYVLIGWRMETPIAIPMVDWIRVIPYLLVLIFALRGWNVMLVLCLGIVSCGLIGLWKGAFDVYEWMGAMGRGIAGMGDLIAVTLLAGGMFELIRRGGGIDYIMHHLSLHVHGKRGAELCIAVLVCISNLCTANNTIAILASGRLARDISGKYGVPPARAASLLDTFSCFVQGLIPYGAQLLMAASLTGLSPLGIMGYLYYPFLMGAAALSAVCFRWPKRYI
ncbi:MAG: Na+/H+ antiporter NhaC family protein [Bacteroidaceae bacterium]|jgi:Na+/H+ antiporter NhaC